jgi:glycosyltransferase involved in cell wall biosynthesis
MAAKGKIKILIVLNTLGVGGAEVQIARAAPHFNREKFEIQVAYYSKALQGHPIDMLNRAGIKVTFLNRDAWGKAVYFMKATRFMRRERFDIVHAWTGTANLYGRVPALMAGVPAIIGGLRGRRTANGLMGAIYSLTNWRCAGWIVNAEEIKKIAMRKLKFMRHCPMYVVPNGIEIDDETVFRRDEKTFYDSLRRNRPVIGAIGRLVPVKNYKLFLSMARKVRSLGIEADYWIIGEGPQWNEIKELISQYRLQDCVRMLGYRKDADEGIARMDLIALTSDSEGCPNVLLEALRASLPILSTKCSSLEKIVEEGRNGYLVPCGNANAMADNAAVLLTDPELRKTMGKESRKIVEERFAMPIAVKNLERVYVDCLRRGGRNNKQVMERLDRLGL